MKVGLSLSIPGTHLVVATSHPWGAGACFSAGTVKAETREVSSSQCRHCSLTRLYPGFMLHQMKVRAQAGSGNFG